MFSLGTISAFFSGYGKLVYTRRWNEAEQIPHHYQPPAPPAVQPHSYHLESCRFHGGSPQTPGLASLDAICSSCLESRTERSVAGGLRLRGDPQANGVSPLLISS